MTRERRVPPVLTAEAQTIADAAMAVFDGDLSLASAYLTGIGCAVTITPNGHELHWLGGPAVSSGGFTVGGDPVTPCILLLFATYGGDWTHQSGASALGEVNRRWHNRAKAVPAEKGVTSAPEV